MKLSVLSGAYKNAGDFLIVERSIKLLKYVYPQCEIKVYERRIPLDEHIEEINKTDALIFAGGPAYSPSIYPNEIPLVRDLSQIKVPIYTIGLGWYGRNTSSEVIYNDYKFSSDTQVLLKRLERDGTLACRDWYSVRVLKNNGFSNFQMTGCPAWYDLNNVDKLRVRNDHKFPYQKICFSDPANPNNFQQSLDIVKYIRSKYPDAQLIYVFHRGITKDNNTDADIAEKYLSFSEQLSELDVEIRDISYSADGFQVYDDCDLHIGMRVHAHIYNLSVRNVSILIEEDGRGAGVNEALGLFSIKAYRPSGILPAQSTKIIDRSIRYICRKLYGNQSYNPYLLYELDDYLEMLERTDFCVINQAFVKQKDYFNLMINHISGFSL